MCVSKSLGNAKRTCFQGVDGGAKWGVPDLSECVSDKMANIAQQVGRILSRLETLREFRSIANIHYSSPLNFLRAFKLIT